MPTIAQWSGTTWVAYGRGVPGQVNALAASNHDLYAADGFTNAGSAPATNIAHFNGTTWVNMGTTGFAGSAGTCAAAGVTMNICAVTVDPSADGLYTGGRIGMAGASTPSAVALWTATSLKLSVTDLASPSPTSVKTNTTFTATVKNTGTTSASGVTLTSSIPANTTFVSATPSQGTCSLSGSTPKCTLGSLGAQGSGMDTARVAVVLDPTPSGTTISDTVRSGESGTSFTNSAKAVGTVN